MPSSPPAFPARSLSATCVPTWTVFSDSRGHCEVVAGTGGKCVASRSPYGSCVLRVNIDTYILRTYNQVASLHLKVSVLESNSTPRARPNPLLTAVEVPPTCVPRVPSLRGQIGSVELPTSIRLAAGSEIYWQGALPPTSSVKTCLNTCSYASDGICADGGPGAQEMSWRACTLGTDCADCGPRGHEWVQERLDIFFLDSFSRQSYPEPFSTTYGDTFMICASDTAQLPQAPPPPSDVASPPPALTEATCLNTCSYASDGDCDDGGPGAAYSSCGGGTDCADCGPRGSTSFASTAATTGSTSANPTNVTTGAGGVGGSDDPSSSSAFTSPAAADMLWEKRSARHNWESWGWAASPEWDISNVMLDARFDLDGNAQLTLAELTAALTQLGQVANAQYNGDVATVFADADFDGDGELSAQELLQLTLSGAVSWPQHAIGWMATCAGTPQPSTRRVGEWPAAAVIRAPFKLAVSFTIASLTGGYLSYDGREIIRVALAQTANVTLSAVVMDWHPSVLPPLTAAHSGEAVAYVFVGGDEAKQAQEALQAALSSEALASALMSAQVSGVPVIEMQTRTTPFENNRPVLNGAFFGYLLLALAAWAPCMYYNTKYVHRQAQKTRDDPRRPFHPQRDCRSTGCCSVYALFGWAKSMVVAMGLIVVSTALMGATSQAALGFYMSYANAIDDLVCDSMRCDTCAGGLVGVQVGQAAEAIGSELLVLLRDWDVIFPRVLNGWFNPGWGQATIKHVHLRALSSQFDGGEWSDASPRRQFLWYADMIKNSIGDLAHAEHEVTIRPSNWNQNDTYVFPVVYFSNTVANQEFWPTRPNQATPSTPRTPITVSNNLGLPPFIPGAGNSTAIYERVCQKPREETLTYEVVSTDSISEAFELELPRAVKYSGPVLMWYFIAFPFLPLLLLSVCCGMRSPASADTSCLHTTTHWSAKCWWLISIPLALIPLLMLIGVVALFWASFVQPEIVWGLGRYDINQIAIPPAYCETQLPLLKEATQGAKHALNAGPDITPS